MNTHMLYYSAKARARAEMWSVSDFLLYHRTTHIHRGKSKPSAVHSQCDLDG